MGGRGGNSGISRGNIQAFSVTKDSETTQYKFFAKGSKNYIQRGIGGRVEESPLNMSAAEFRRRVESNGGTVKKLSVSEWDKKEKAMEKAHRNRPDYELGVGLKDNSAYRKKARKDRIINRSMKRR